MIASRSSERGWVRDAKLEKRSGTHRGTNNNCLRAARCIRATRFGEIDDLPFALLRAHILIQRIALSHAWLCSMAQVEPLEETG